MKALLIIDMQRGSFTAETPRHDAEGVISRINQLAGRFRSSGDPVLFIQHDGTIHGDFIPGSEAWKLLPELEIRAEDSFIAKTANDCFYKSELTAALQKQQITEVVITGCATDFCVDTTVKSAVAKEYKVTVIADAHTTADREGITAESLIAHYNWVWKNMLPVEQRHIDVSSMERYLSRLVNA